MSFASDTVKRGDRSEAFNNSNIEKQETYTNVHISLGERRASTFPDYVVVV